VSDTISEGTGYLGYVGGWAPVVALIEPLEAGEADALPRLLREVHRAGLVTSFDWPTWMTGRGRELSGDPVAMSAGDLVLTPSWTFHEHHNPSEEPMLWMDVLDLPVVEALEAVFFEEGPSEDVERLTEPVSRSERSYGAPGLLPPLGQRTAPRHSPLLAYRWADTDRALSRRLDVTNADAVTMTYVDPSRGTDVMPTMRCEAHRVRAGHQSPLLRQTGSRVATVFRGNGVAVVGNDRFDIAPGDIIAIPSWTPWRLEAHVALDVFSTCDAPVLDALGFYREEELS
jgi:gentisate 1,2-dioxygenase